ncbi:MAG: metallophosphoesterase family protein [Geminicoccaceae bacterium]
MRLIHTADWHIGKVFRFVGDETMPLLQDARVDAVKRLGELALEHDADTVLVAGDVYDKEGLTDRTLAQPLERMRAFANITWHLIPGNHDPYRQNGIWQRVRAIGLPKNVEVHVEAAPIALSDCVYLLPAPLHLHQSIGDPTAWMEDAATPADARRIGLAHGSITEFGINTQTPNLIDPDRAKRAGLAYLALGDWHGAKKINQRTWYAGTPEPDRFDRPESGQALLVEIKGKAAPKITSLKTGHFRWVTEHTTIYGIDDIKNLTDRLRNDHENLASLLLDLRIDGSLSLAGRAYLEHDVEVSLSAALCHLRLSLDDLIVNPSPDDLNDLAHDYVVRAAVERLKTMAAADDDQDRETAARALQHLYLACHKRQREAAA